MRVDVHAWLRPWRGYADDELLCDNSPGMPPFADQQARLRALAPLGFVLIAAALLCGGLGYLLARQSDDRQDLEQRHALIAAVQDFRRAAGSGTTFDVPALRKIEGATGLKGLRWEAGRGDAARELQPMIENGRIVGWFSWDRDARVTAAVTQLWPLLILGVLCLAGFIGLSLWHVSRSGRALTTTRAQMRALATDSHTGLLNTSAMLKVLEQALAHRQPHQVITCLLIEINRFDDVIAAIGQQASDEVLMLLAARLKAAVSGRYTLGSLGGGRFAAVVASDRRETHAVAVRAALSALATPVELHGEAVEVEGHIGFACAPEHGLTAGDIFRRADLALDTARRGEGGKVLAFEGRMEAAHEERQELKRELKRAIAARALEVEYQPIVAAEGYRIVGVEALLRWTHPRHGPIPPMTFIPLAEQGGLMDDLGDFVLTRALADAKRWPGLYVAANLSPVQLRDRTRVERIAEIVRSSGIDRSRVILEITESVLIDDPDRVKASISLLRALGCRIALDDFGAGYSSLAYLRQFPIDRLKVDKGFVTALGQAENADVIIQAIVSLGRALGLRVVVEGVETEEQRVLLRLAGCDEMQGFLFAKPGKPQEITRMLAAAEAATAARVSVAA